MDYRFTALPVAANTSVKITRQSLRGFLCKTAGTVTVVNNKGVTIVDTHPVAAGVWYYMPFLLQDETGGTFTTAGGASGVVAV